MLPSVPPFSKIVFGEVSLKGAVPHKLPEKVENEPPEEWTTEMLAEGSPSSEGNLGIREEVLDLAWQDTGSK